MCHSEVLYDPPAAAAAAKSLQSCPTLCNPIDWQPTRLPRPWDSPGKKPGVGDSPATVMQIKAKINKLDLIKPKGFCTMTETISKVKTILTMGENNSKQNN